MERLVVLVLKLLLQLAWVLLRLVLRVVLFLWTKDWHKLDKVEAQVREAIESARAEQAPKSPQAMAKSPRAPRTKPPRATPDRGPWPFEFAPEITDDEPQSELQGGEALMPSGARTVIQPTKRAPRRKAPAPRKELPLALAVHDPRTIRDAMVLTAVLGRRDRRDRRF